MRRALLAATMLVCAAAGFALDPDFINPRVGVMIINNVVAGDIGAPDALVNTFGVSLAFPFEKIPSSPSSPGGPFLGPVRVGERREGASHGDGDRGRGLCPGGDARRPVFYTWEFGDRLRAMAGAGGAVFLRAAFLASGASSDTDVRPSAVGSTGNSGGSIPTPSCVFPTGCRTCSPSNSSPAGSFPCSTSWIRRLPPSSTIP